ncbi:MAG: UPF0104 family protein [Ardenticatenaceae bacterium]|nr:UPF0104 family protein [Ardenticatenaceae bacterium]
MIGKTSWHKHLRPFQIHPLTITWLRHLFPLLMAGLAVHLLLPQLTNLEHAWQTIQQMPWWLVVMAVLAQIISYGGSGYLLTALAAMLHERLPITQGMLITLGSSSIGLVAGGVVGSSAATYRWGRASGLSNQTAGLCGTLPSLFNNLLLALIAIAGLLHLLIIHQLTRWQMVSFGLILALLAMLVIGGIWGVSHPTWLLTTLTRFSRKWAALRKRPYNPTTTADKVNHLVNTWVVLRNGGWRGPTVGALLSIIFDMLTLSILFIAAGHAVNPGILLTGYGLPLLIGRVGFLPGGVGIVEATMTTLYVSLGVPNNVIVVVILGYRLISFWLPTLLGFPVALYLQSAKNPA